MAGRRVLVFLVAFVLVASVASAQQPAAAPVPPVMKISGTIVGVVGSVPATFTLYAEQYGGASLWSERQYVGFDELGHYSVLLGSASAEGLPVALFADGQARWLGIQVDGQAEQPRILLASVAYALKAGDAATVGGKPLSAFVLAGDTTGVGADGLTYVDKKAIGQALSTSFAPSPTSSGSPGYIGVFTTATDLGNSVMYQSGTSVGVNTTAPAAGFHSAASSAPGAFFDVYSNALGALPVVNRAARGSVGAPTAVQANDILGGLAVRGYGATGFGAGVGQVMFRAAQNFSDAAQGTFLQMTTTPLNSNLWVERMRITPEGNVGIGTAAPAATLDVAGSQRVLNRIELDIANAHTGVLTYDRIGALMFGPNSGEGIASARTAGAVNLWGLNFYTSYAPRMAITHSGLVGIGTLTPAQTLDVVGTINASGAITAGAGITATGPIKGGPGTTPTPIAHGFFSADGTRQSGSSNITCAWVAASVWYACTITGEAFDFRWYTVNVTPAGEAVIAATNSVSGQLLVQFFSVSGSQVQSTYGFGVTVFKQ